MSFELFFDEVAITVKQDDYCSLYTEEVLSQINCLTDQDSLKVLKEYLNKYELDCLPRIVIRNDSAIAATIGKSLISDSVLVIHKKLPYLDKKDNNVKYALLLGRVAAAMARADGEIDDDEVSRIKTSIYEMKSLALDQKYLVYARTLYWLKNHASSARLIESFAGLTNKAQGVVIDVAKAVAVANGYIDSGEVNFMRQLYESASISTKTLKRDIELYAQKHGVYLVKKRAIDTFELEVPELDDSLDVLLDEFDF